MKTRSVIVCLLLLPVCLVTFNFSGQAANLISPINGGLLEHSTSEYGCGWFASDLSNGMTNEDGWASAYDPAAESPFSFNQGDPAFDPAQEFVYSFKNGSSAVLQEAVIHGGLAEGKYYSKDVEVWVSADGFSYSRAGRGMLGNSPQSTVRLNHR
jgi:hypothetical protein